MEKLSRQLELSSNFHLLSIAIERAAYYGFRTIIILHMVSETIKMPREEALSIYGIFTSIVILSRIFGAIIGDFLFGNRAVLIWGGLLQMLGAFVFCIDSLIAIYIGLGLVSIGSGFYYPNLFAQFGKLYKKRKRLLDAGFIAFYLAISAGSFIGVLGIGYVADIDFKFGFILSGLLFLIATIILIQKKAPVQDITSLDNNYPKNIIQICITIIFFTSGLYWLAYEQGSTVIYQSIYEATENITNTFFKEIVKNFNSLATIIFCFVALVYWRNNHLKRIIKIIGGLVSAAIGFLMIMILAKNGSSANIPFLLIALSFIGISEVLIAPTIHSILVVYVKSKYIATIYSLLVIPTRLFTALFIFIEVFEYDEIQPILVFSIILLLLLGIALYLLRDYFIETENMSMEIDEIGRKNE